MISNNEEIDYNYGLSLSLKLYGLSVHPSKVTEILGIQPTSCRGIGDAGEILGTSMKITLVPSKHNVWAYSTGRVEDSEFMDHWIILFGQIQGKKEYFTKLKNLVECTALSINIGVGKFVPGIEIPAEVLAVISDFGFRLDYDVVL